MQSPWAVQVQFPCLKRQTSSRESVAQFWQVACVAHMAREGHLMSAESCAEMCEQPVWLRSKLDPWRPVSSVCLEGFTCGVWQLLSR